MLKQLEQNLRSLRFNEVYIKENIANIEKWEKVGLLKDITDTHIWRQLSRLFENQKLFNEEKDDLSIQWRRLSIPCIRRIFGNFLPYKLVSVQSLSKDEDVYNFADLTGRGHSQIIQTRIRRIVPYEFPEIQNFESEMEFVESFSLSYLKEIEREVVQDLINIAGSRAKAKYANEQELLALVEGMSAYISSKIYRDATWIVTNPQIAEQLRSVIGNRWTLYEMEMGPAILMGYKDQNHFFSGYCYCPYKPFITSDKNQMFSRYGKTLINADFYGVIDLTESES